MTARETMFDAVDLFAGPGGWDLGIGPLGIRPLGIEWDAAACDTRDAAGHKTVREDVSTLHPRWYEPCELLIASPPCQAFSVAGKGDGHKDVPLILETAKALCDGEDIRAEVRDRCADQRSLLVVEPLRWALELKPRWIAMEQVPPVLPLWQHFGGLLSQHGYFFWAGTLSAERYGVPQTRERAFLIASLDDNPPEPPRATHQEYVFGVPAREQHTLEGTLLPWVSMAEALGWQEGSAEYRLARGEGMLERHGQRPNTPDNRPAPVMTSKARTAQWVIRDARSEEFSREPRTESEPAATLGSTSRQWTWTRPAPTVVTTRRSKDGLLVGRQMAEGEGENVGGWGYERPATTIAGDSRVFQPGGHHEPGKQSQNAVRVTEAEAAILQGFPSDYPWQGSRTKRFEQIGNAVPPPLAQAVVTALLGSELVRRTEAVAA